MKERRRENFFGRTNFDRTPAVFLTDPANHVAGDAKLCGIVIGNALHMTEFGEMRELMGDTVETPRGELEPKGVEIGCQGHVGRPVL